MVHLIRRITTIQWFIFIRRAHLLSKRKRHRPIASTISPSMCHFEAVRDLKMGSSNLRNSTLLNMEPVRQHFATKSLAKMYVAEKSIKKKKPFKVSRSNPRRYEVVCVEKSCLFRLNIRAKRMICSTSPKHTTNTLVICSLQRSKSCG